MFILKVFRSGLNTPALNQNLYSFGILVPRLFIFSWHDTVIQISLSSSSLGVKCYYECLRRARVNGIGFLRSSKVVDECQVSILQKIYLMKMPPYTHKCSCKKCGILGEIMLYKTALLNSNSCTVNSSQNNCSNISTQYWLAYSDIDLSIIPNPSLISFYYCRCFCDVIARNLVT